MNAFIASLARKLSSRKLWMAIAIVTGGISVAMGNDASEIQSVTGMVSALIGSIVYIITEGKIDAAGIGNVASQVEDIKEALDAVEG
jgi:hypothetical protein